MIPVNPDLPGVDGLMAVDFFEGELWLNDLCLRFCRIDFDAPLKVSTILKCLFALSRFEPPCRMVPRLSLAENTREFSLGIGPR